jgi:hypothetical protein
MTGIATVGIAAIAVTVMTATIGIVVGAAAATVTDR